MLTISEYNRDQSLSFLAIARACEGLAPEEIEVLKDSAQSYLLFRKELDDFQNRYFLPDCKPMCFDTDMSACCGFESIYTFFADQVVNWLFSSHQERAALLEVLDRPNTSGKCVYLAEAGCIWRMRPISCAMFLCDQVKRKVFERHPEAEALFEELKRREKEFTFPTKPVLFDDLEKAFMKLGVDSPHMYFHRSPGLLRVKAKAGLSG